jgi:hypothetical protein
MIRHILGRYTLRFPGVASSARQVSSTSRRSLGSDKRSLLGYSLAVEGCFDMEAEHARHIDVKRSDDRVDPIPEVDVDVAHLVLVHFTLAPLGKRLEELPDGNEKSCYSRLSCGLQPR